LPIRSPVHVSAKWLARRLDRTRKAGHEAQPKLIVGLGNPGIRYRRSRHNVGFLVLDRFAEHHRFSFSRRRFNAMLAEGLIRDHPVLLAKPQTYMNLSGGAVAKLVSFRRIPTRDIIIVYDDLDLPIGKVRLRARGSAGGHHGMESIIAALGRDEFARLRIGIGRPATHEDINHVLGSITDEEHTVLEEAFDRSVEALDVWLDQGIDIAMNKFNS
jgi:peptidyl-tRNA hydrolase, PTH1 family